MQNDLKFKSNTNTHLVGASEWFQISNRNSLNSDLLQDLGWETTDN